jgi:hypothetical protein
VTDESTIDPLSTKADLFGLASTALLRLAYMRLNIDRGACSGLLWGDHRVIVGNNPTLDRSLHVERAVLHAAHALSIPVRMGVNFMANSKTSIWCVEHSVCSLESALLLKAWLEMISTIVRSSGIGSLRTSEKRLLRIITAIIKETDYAETLYLLENDASRYQSMAATVVELWTRVFQGVHVLEIDDDVRCYLQLVKDSTRS